MNNLSDVLQETTFEDPQQLGPEPLDGRQRSTAEWTGELLVGTRQPVQFHGADWP